MIVSDNRTPQLPVFKALMERTDLLLNDDARKRQNYYIGRNGTLLEEDVYRALCSSSIGSEFENTIRLVSGASFPDIVASGYYGVEVKSTKNNSWKSIGSSILESTRVPSVERVYLTFGKLGVPVEFRSRPYEECLYDISVTHYPRYQIDMELLPGDTIFDKIGIPYDKLRKMDNPVLPVSKYYKKHLKQGESLWWAPNSNLEMEAVPMKVRLWSALAQEEKTIHTIRAYAMFPEIFGSSNTKYQRYSLWLVTTYGIVNTNIRDQFSAGGKVNVHIRDNAFCELPSTFSRIVDFQYDIARFILNASYEDLINTWNVDFIRRDRISQWCDLVANSNDKIDRSKVKNLLYLLFQNFINAQKDGKYESCFLESPIATYEYTRDIK